MGKKIHFFILFVYLFPLIVGAQSVSPDLAMRVATAFLANMKVDNSNRESHRVLVETIGNQAERPTLYAISMDSMWVLIAGDQQIYPILAYSDENSGRFPLDDETPPSMHIMLAWYHQQIQSIIDGQYTRNQNAEWQKYLAKSEEALTNGNRSAVVAPLLTRNGNENQWGQSQNNEEYSLFNPIDTNKVYNKFCPPGTSCSHTIAGCDATAMSQVMWYWMWPDMAAVQNDNHISLLRHYSWDNMPYALYNSTNLSAVNMVATLLHDAGVGISTTYGCSGSSAIPQNIPIVMETIFGYNEPDMIYREDYNENDWIEILRDELDNGQPIIYSGWDEPSSEGHTFVIDGYDTNGKFHANFGWRGSGNGYYMLNALSYGSYTFSVNQNAIIGITPNYCFPITIPPLPLWNENFSIQHSGGITIHNRTIGNNLQGSIVSGTYIRLKNGVHIQAGANVHLAIQNSGCGGNNSGTNNLPSRHLLLDSSDNSSSSEDVTSELLQVVYNPTNKMIRILNGEEISMINIYSISGQHIFSAKRKDINISTLPSGVYIVHVQTVTGERLVERIVHM